MPLPPSLDTRRRLAVTSMLLWALTGCVNIDDHGMYGGGQLCLDRAKRENALYLESIGTALSPSQYSDVTEWNGCDSANNGAEVHVAARVGLEAKTVRAAFEKAGWSDSLAAEAGKRCAPHCEELHLARKMGERIIGVAIETDGTVVWVTARDADFCWDDDGYRCPS